MAFFDKLKSIVPDNLSDVTNAVGSLISKKSNDAKPATQTGRKSKPSSVWSDELERMVSLAIEDGELTDRELQLLASRAEREGIDPDEFEFTIRLRMRQHAKEAQALKDIPPIAALSQALSMMESYAKGGEKVVKGSALSAAMAVIPGVGQWAALGTVLSKFIETPSNLNKLKAEVIRRFVLPDDSEQLKQFISYGASQIKEAQLQEEALGSSIKKIISSVAMGSDIDIIPIWEQKIDDACDMANNRYPGDCELMSVVKKYRPTLINKLREGRIDFEEANDIMAPKDDDELLEVVEYLYGKKNDDLWDEIKPIHARMYKEAEKRFASNPSKLEKLSLYKIKKFGLF